MNVGSAIDAARQAVSARPDRPATAILHDAPDIRLVVFKLDPGQAVAPHTSRSSVVLVILEGRGTVSGGSGSSPVKTGDVVTYEAGELHGFTAGEERLTVLAAIAPRPGGGR